ncbi:hypothetical protein [Actinacidiphila acididurans]|uniref:Proteinase inhibitor I42 chagasin domain-containing protein n=1 Tax=Actinacidiphila acididurans TaxID=2784346 RepID=A0ABS2U427_9ACTN|nr:hypothetical protein [Actinacidiphila acididurans]MBM9510374.1 hypothetical protein [Actinacidiphila acididurans]
MIRRAALAPLASLAAVCCLAVACSATGSGSGSGSAGAGPASSPPPRAVVLDEHAAGTTVRLRVGTSLLVRLHSTYWSAPAGSDPAVLAPDGPGGATPGGRCVPGGGCGTSQARFTATRPGTAHITAHRTTCGEARLCSPAQRRYEVTVIVAAAG